MATVRYRRRIEKLLMNFETEIREEIREIETGKADPHDNVLKWCVSMYLCYNILDASQVPTANLNNNTNYTTLHAAPRIL